LTKTKKISLLSKRTLKIQALADAKFTNFQNAVRTPLQCSKGCSQCCIVQLSIFKVEVVEIFEWFLNLSFDQSNEILSQLQRPKEMQNQCAFLRDGCCVIYPARPTICRTQGMAIQLDETTTSAQPTLGVDICPLNSDSLRDTPAGYFLKLEKLNELLCTLEIEFERESKAGYDSEAKEFSKLLDRYSGEPRIALDQVCESLLKLREPKLTIDSNVSN
jgi:uncharacterized protein